MVVKIRLARFGRRRAPFYNIVVAQARFVLLLSTGLPFRASSANPSNRTARNSKPIEVLGMPSNFTQLHDQSFNQRRGSVSRRKWVTAQRAEADEKTGTYDPIPKAPIDGEGKRWKDIKLDSARAKYWLGVGAQPSDPVWRLLSMVCPTLNSGCMGEVLDWKYGCG